MLNDPDKRKKVILKTAIGVLIFTVLWIVGMVCQYAKHYAAWQRAGGFASGAVLEKTSWNPFICIWYVLSSGGIVLILLIAVLALCAYGWVRIHDRFESKDLDVRGYAYAKNGTYGTARFMTHEEVQEAFQVDPIKYAKGIILCRLDDDAVQLPRKSGENLNVMIYGQPGSGKSRAMIRAAIYNAILSKESAIVIDTKGEMYADTSDLARRSNHKIRVFNLVKPSCSDSWNCFDAILDSRGTADFDVQVNTCVNIIIANTSTGKVEEAVYLNGYTSLLKALILYVVLDPNRKEEDRTLPEAYALLCDHTFAELAVIFKHLPRKHPAKLAWHFFIASTDGLHANILSGLGTRLQILQSKSVCSIISQRDISLTDPAKEPCIYYCIIPDRDNPFEFISSLFFSFLFIELLTYADAHGRKCPVPVNMILDEVCNIGTLGAKADGSSFAKTISVARSRDIRCMLAIQSLGQFQNRYANTLWSEIIGCCDTQVLLGCNDPITAEYWSELSGTATVQVKTEQVQKQTINPIQIIPQYGERYGEGKRSLVTPDEARNLDETFGTPNTLLVYSNNHHLLRGQKLDFSLLPIAKEIAQYDIQDYKPVRFRTEEEIQAEAEYQAEEAEKLATLLDRWEEERQEQVDPMTAGERVRTTASDVRSRISEIHLDRAQLRKKAAHADDDELGSTRMTFYGAAYAPHTEEADTAEDELEWEPEPDPGPDLDFSDLPAPESSTVRDPHTRCLSTTRRGTSAAAQPQEDTEQSESPTEPSKPKPRAKKAPTSGAEAEPVPSAFVPSEDPQPEPTTPPPDMEEDDDVEPLWLDTPVPPQPKPPKRAPKSKKKQQSSKETEGQIAIADALEEFLQQ